jgi:hypothetical protein
MDSFSVGKADNSISSASFTHIHAKLSITIAVHDGTDLSQFNEGDSLAACRREQNSNHGSRQASMHVV